MRDYFHVLGVAPNARAEEIQRACRQLARRYHPDISGEEPVGACLETVAWAPGPAKAEARAVAAAGADGCLDDEIAIDFPSIDGALDRMRVAFFGRLDAAPVVTAEVSLTPQEAFFGAVVPLRLPVRAVCRACGGRGESWREPCPACAGTGEVMGLHDLRLEVPPGVAEGATVRIGVTAPAAPPTLVDVRIFIA